MRCYMTTKQDLQNLIKTIEEKQTELLKEMNVINVSDRWVAASRRARVLSSELTKLYKQYRTDSMTLIKAE